MKFSKKQIEELMDQYLQDNDDFGNYNETETINEVFNNYKTLLIENTNENISISLLKEHSNKLEDTPKDIFNDFILYLQMTELDSRLL
jgi:hypothetical protein